MRCALAIAALMLALPVSARDLGQFGNASQSTREWFRGLHSADNTWCCDEADGQRVEDPNWRIEGDSYAVLIGGEWVKVPPSALVLVPNKMGFAIAWFAPGVPDGQGKLRCFMPGTAS